MAKIYGTPIGGGGTGTNTTLSPLLDNFKASKAEGATTPIKETASGTKVYFGTLNGQRLIWRVSRYSKDNKIYFISDDILPEDMEYDAIEPSNPNGTTATYGNSNLLLSNIYQWLNSDKGANEWYTATHEYDAPPNYQNKAGFLNEWSDMEKSLIQEHERQTLEEITKVPGEPGELPQDQYTFTNHTHKVSLLDYTESAPEGSISGAEHFDVFTDDDSRKQSRISFSNGPIDIQNGSWVPMVLTDGTRKGGLSAGDSSHSGNGVRPIVPINEDLTYISKEPDESGIYEVVDPNSFVTISADKISENRAQNLLGAVWVYGDHVPQSLSDGTRIDLTRNDVIQGIRSTESTVESVSRTVSFDCTKNFFARQFTYNERKQYQTTLEGAIAELYLSASNPEDIEPGSTISVGTLDGSKLKWRLEKSTSGKKFLVLDPESAITFPYSLADTTDLSKTILHQWLNSDKESGWYTPIGDTDTTSSYYSYTEKPGFLSLFTSGERASFKDKEWKYYLISPTGTGSSEEKTINGMAMLIGSYEIGSPFISGMENDIIQPSGTYAGPVMTRDFADTSPNYYGVTNWTKEGAESVNNYDLEAANSASKIIVIELEDDALISDSTDDDGSHTIVQRPMIPDAGLRKVFEYGNTPPSNTDILWIDSTTKVLYAYNGKDWTPMTGVYGGTAQ